MSDRAAASAALERALYAYVFDADVSDRFRSYREHTRVERFRHHYLVRLAEHMARLMPRFVAEVGPPQIEDVIALRVELARPDSTPAERLSAWQPLALASAARHPRPALARELFWLERARALTLAQPPASRARVLAAIDELAARERDAGASPDDHPPVVCVTVRSSLPELLAMPLSTKSCLDSAARMPWPRHCISYHDASDGRLHRKCARDFDALRELVASCPGGVDL